MAGKLSEFASEIRNRNVSRPTLFYVQLTAPSGDAALGPTNENPSRSTDRLISFLCYETSTPTGSFLTQDNYSTAGTKRKFAYDYDHQNTTLRFYCDQNYEIKKYFDKWKNIILPDRRNFGYSKDYTSPALELFILNLQDKEVYQYTYTNVYPKTISSVDLSWQAGNQVSSFTVEFVYEEVYFTQKSGVEGESGESSFKARELNIPNNPISQISNREIQNFLQTQSSNNPEVQTIIEAFGGGVAGALLP